MATPARARRRTYTSWGSSAKSAGDIEFAGRRPETSAQRHMTLATGQCNMRGMDKKIAAGLALIAKTNHRKKLLAIAENADKQGVAIVAEQARLRFDALVAEDASDPIVPAWESMIQTSEKTLGHRHNYARRMIENRVKAGYSRREAIAEALTGWALSPKPTEGFLAMVKAGSLSNSGEALVVRFADAFPASVVAAAQRRLDDARRGAFNNLA
jgi:hypothetical protein